MYHVALMRKANLDPSLVRVGYNFGNGYSLDGSTQRLDCAGMVGTTLSNDWTYILWYRNHPTTYRTMGLFSGGNTNYFGLSLQFQTPNIWSYIFIMAAPTVGNAQSSTVPLSGINCIALVRDSSLSASLRYKFYHNGLDVSPGSNTISTYATTVQTEWRIGDYFGSNKFRGVLGEELFMPGVISFAQYAEYYNKGKGSIILDGLSKTYWHKMEDTSDSSGNSKTLSLTGAPPLIKFAA